MSRPPVDEARWRPWIDHVCAAVGVDPALVDVPAIHGLAGEVAAAFDRPMAPVAGHLWGLALASGTPADAARAAILDAAREARRS